ncbi:ATP-dependent DNA ligase [Pseudomonas phage vB_PpuP-KiKu]
MFELPKRKHLVHKPVEFRNLCAEAKKRIVSVSNDQYIWQLKYDGCHAILIKQGDKCWTYSREGNLVKSMDHVENEFVFENMQDGVYFGEAWNAHCTFPQISGMFRRQYTECNGRTGTLQYIVFDRVTLEEFTIGVSNESYGERWRKLHDDLMTAEAAHFRPALSFVYSDKEFDASEARLVQAREHCICGTDGYIAKRIGGDWTAGDGKKGQTIKVKDHISVDLLCVAVEEGKGKFAGMIGSLLVEWKGQVVPVSGGKLTNDERANIQLCGKIVEVHALGLTPDGQLREPRYQRIRHDKTEPSE